MDMIRIKNSRLIDSSQAGEVPDDAVCPRSNKDDLHMMQERLELLATKYNYCGLGR